MERIRSIRAGFFTDEAFCTASPSACLLAIGIWTQCDDHGIFEWKPFDLRVKLFPVSNVDIDVLLDELIGKKVIQRFEVDGKAYGCVRNFCKFQKPKRRVYKFPYADWCLAYAGHGSADGAPDGDERDAEEAPTGDKIERTARHVTSPRPTEPTEAPGRGVERSGEKKQGNLKTNIESLERVAPDIVETMPSASPPGSLSKAANQVFKEGPKKSPLATAMGTELPINWTPDDELCDQVKAEFGMTDDDIRSELTEFHRQYGNGSFSTNWRSSFGTWCKRWKEHRDKQAPPRVQVSNAGPRRPEKFDEAEWDKVAAFYAKTGRWIRDSGPDPMSPACKCPRIILERHGIDERGERRMPAKAVNA
jgi:hypothetical protein